MRYDDPDLQDRLAAQYALGALSALTRRRLEALMQERPELQARVAAWQEQLAPLADFAPPIVPPAHVLNALHRRLFHGHAARQRPAWWDRAALWRWTAGAALAAAAALIAYVVVEPGLLDEAPVVAERQISPSYVAVLADEAERPGIVVTAFNKPWRLAVEPLEGLTAPQGAVLQIWAVERDTGTTRPLVKLADRTPTQLSMSEAMWSMVKNAESLVVSVDEPEAEAPGRILYAGLCIRLDGPPELRSGSPPEPERSNN